MNQATSLGEALKNEPITHIFSSDLKRASRTATAIKDHHPNVSIVSDKLFREQDLGRLEGKPWQPTSTAGMNKSKKSHAVSDKGESRIAMKERASCAWNMALQHADVFGHPDDLFIVIVSHGLFLSTLFKTICVFYDVLRPANVFWSNTGYLKFTVDSNRDPAFKIDCINQTSHLSAVQRQKGGIGSSQYDKSQKTMLDYFPPSPERRRKNQGNSPFLAFPPFPMMIKLYRPVLRILCGTNN